MICQEKQRLFQAYTSGIEAYLVVLTDILREREYGIISTKDFDRMHQLSEAMLQGIASARMQLDTHLEAHCC